MVLITHSIVEKNKEKIMNVFNQEILNKLENA